MAIRVKTGLTIPSVAAPDAEPDVAEALAGADPIDLGMNLVNQEQFQWCWAACTVMVAARRNVASPDQSGLANRRTQRNDCSRFNPVCDVPSDANQMVGIYAFIGIAGTATPITRAHASANNRAIQRHLADGKPVQIGWQWNGGGRHVVVIGGYTEWNGDDFYWILNPAQHLSSAYWLSFDSLYTADGAGDWILALTF